MKLLRTIFAKRIFTLIAGLTFMNMSFFLAEATLLGIDKNSSIVKNFINCGLEEEKETSESPETGDSVKEVLLSLEEHIFYHQIIFQTESHQNKVLSNLTTLDGHQQIFSPPPEIHTSN